MISQEFLDLSVMFLKEEYDVWIGNEQVHKDLEAYFNKKYDYEKVVEAIDLIIELYQYQEVPYDYEC